MNFRKILIFSLTFFLFLSSVFSDEPVLKGKALSDYVYNTARVSGGKPKIESLVTSLPNAFAYNIRCSFNGSSLSHATILISQEDAGNHPDLISRLIESFSQDHLFCNTDLVFIYEMENKAGNPDKQNMVNGYEKYLLNSETTDSFYFIVDLDEIENQFLTFSSGNSSSSVLVSQVFNAFLKNQIQLKNTFFISQMGRLPLFSNSDLDCFFTEGRDAIKICFSSCEKTESIGAVVTDFISAGLIKEKDSHSIIIRFGNHLLNLSEQTTLLLFFVIIIITLTTLFTFSVVNKNFNIRSWKKLSGIWYYPLVSFLVSVGSFYFFRHAISFSQKTLLFTASTEWFILWSISFMLFIQCILGITLVNFPLDFKRHTVDYLILYSVSVSMYIFSLTDISLLPLYFLLFIFSLIPLFVKNAYVSIVQLFLFHLPLFRWLKTLFTQADPFLLRETIFESNLFPWVLVLNITPVFLVTFRIIVSMNFFLYKKNTPVQKKIYLSFFTFLGALILNTILFSVFLGKDLVKNQNRAAKPIEVSVKVKSQDDIKLSYRDKKVFGETIRTIKIDVSRPLAGAELQVTGKTASPVIFSDNDNILVHNRTTEFIIPSYPPEHMEFNFGTDSDNDTAVIFTCWFYDENTGTFEQSQKSIMIRGRR